MRKKAYTFTAVGVLALALFLGAGGIMAQTGTGIATDKVMLGAGARTDLAVPAGFTVIPPDDSDQSDDQILQLNNLTVRKVSGEVPGVIYASQDIGNSCIEYFSVDGGANRAYPCPLAPTILYRIQIENDTILLLRDRSRAAIADFAVGDRINVFGFLDRGTSYMQALIVRDLDKPAVAQFIQLNNLTLLSDPSSNVPPASFRAARTGVEPCISFVAAPRGIAYPCPAGVEISALTPDASDDSANRDLKTVPTSFRPYREYYDIKVGASTRLMNLNRQAIGLGEFQRGDRINVYGRYVPGTRSVEALILRDLSVPRAPSEIGLEITSPNGGEVLPLGGSAQIEWRAKARPYMVLQTNTLVLSLIDGPSQGVIASLTDEVNPDPDVITTSAGEANRDGSEAPGGVSGWFLSGTYAWSIEHVLVGGDAVTNIEPGNYRIKAELYEGVPCTGFCARPETPARLIASDVSDRFFRIANVAAGDAPEISSITPSAGPRGTKVTLRGKFAASGNYVYVGGYNAGDNLQSDGRTLSFIVPAYVGVCSHNSYDPPREPVACIALAMQLPEGPHAVHVVNANGTSNSVTFLAGVEDPH